MTTKPQKNVTWIALLCYYVAINVLFPCSLCILSRWPSCLRRRIIATTTSASRKKYSFNWDDLQTTKSVMRSRFNMCPSIQVFQKWFFWHSVYLSINFLKVRHPDTMTRNHYNTCSSIHLFENKNGPPWMSPIGIFRYYFDMFRNFRPLYRPYADLFICKKNILKKWIDELW